MASVSIPENEITLEGPEEIEKFLAQHGIWYRHFSGGDALGASPTDAEILEAYSSSIEKLNEEGGYVSADVINIKSDTPGLATMLAKFDKEHWHDEDEVRFIVKGNGLFYIHPKEGPVFKIEVGEGDMINVPQGTLHWFHLCEDMQIRAIRLFKNVEGWTPNYTDSKLADGFLPTCFGPSFVDSKSPVHKLG